jgi:hypothetical protein
VALNRRIRGSVSQKKVKRSLPRDRVTEAIKPRGAFGGDAIDFLMWIYRNETFPIGLRLDAAKAAAPFERPRLSATQLTGKDGGPILLEQIVDAAMQARAKAQDRDEPPALH